MTRKGSEGLCPALQLMSGVERLLGSELAELSMLISRSFRLTVTAVGQGILTAPLFPRGRYIRALLEWRLVYDTSHI